MEQLKEIDWAALQAQGTDVGLKLLGAIAIFMIGRIIARMILGGIRRTMNRLNVDRTLQSFLGNIFSVLMTLVVALAAIGYLGVPMSSFIALLGAAGLAIGLALQGSLANFASGVLIIFFRPYRAGDFVDVGGITGSVNSVTIFNTIMTTPDNRRVILPNSNITSGPIINFSANDTRRIDLVIGVSYADDLQKTKEVLMDVLTSEERVLSEPEPVVAVDSLGDSSVNFVVRPWVKTSELLATRFALLQAIKERLDAEDISIPFPQRDVHIVSQPGD